ncbi:phage portal protein [Sphingomonas arantia]|uniref:Phage portal protein n=1 Tax=Sphingomonas arantia TaxID=1460676 RepID=A0ABW4TXC2_9SPHN
MAMRNSVFFRATSLIAGSMGMLPLSLFRRAPDGTTSKATDHRLYQTLKLDPNGFQSPSEFKSFMQLAAVLDGNAFAQVVRLNGEVQALVPYDRGTVQKERRGATLRFKHTPKSGGTTYLDPQDVFHFRAPVSLDGLNGLGLLEVAADTIGLAHLADRAMSKLLRSGVMAGGALQAKEALSDDAYARLKADMREQYSGADNAGEWMVLEEGLEAKPFSGSARDTQFVELMKRQAEEGSRFTGVPRPLLMFDETAWGSGIEQLGLYFVVYCLLPWFVIWEEAVWRLLSVSEKRARNGTMLYAKFNERALLRGSMKDQAEVMARALGSGGGMPWVVQNEARESFDMNPKPGGDYLPRPGTSAATIVEDET